MPKKTKFGVRIPKKVKSPTGRPSKKSSGVKKMEKGDFSGGPSVKKKAKKKKGFQKGTIPKIERALRKAGV